MTDEKDSESDVDIGFRLTSKLGGVSLGGVVEQKEDDPDEDPELYGTSPKVIAIFLTLITLFFPVGAIGLTYNFANMTPLVYGVIWVSPVDKMLVRFMHYIVNPGEFLATIWWTIPLCAFNLLFIHQINRFFYGKTSRDIVLFYGILSMIAPSALSAVLWTSSILPFVITPLPFQFFAGIILLYKFSDPDFTSPWKGYFLDLSWWIRQRHSIHDPNPEVINLTKLLLQHDADWLEGFDEE